MLVVRFTKVCLMRIHHPRRQPLPAAAPHEFTLPAAAASTPLSFLQNSSSSRNSFNFLEYQQYESGEHRCETLHSLQHGIKAQEIAPVTDEHEHC